MLNMHRKLTGEVPNVYRDPVSGAIIASTLISVGASSIEANKAENAAKEERARLAKAEKERTLEAERIERETRPEGESLEAISFGTGDDDELGSVGDFLVEKPTATALGRTSGSGLGFSV